MSGIMKNDRKRPIEQVNALAQKLADQMGYELVEAAFEKEPTGVYLRIYLDVAGGITLNDCETYHMAIQDKVERFEYDFLEVCSPGADRPIKTPRDAERAMGQTVEVKLYRPMDGTKSLVGTFQGLSDAGYHILCGDEEKVIPAKDAAVVRCLIRLEDVMDMDIDSQEDVEQ